MVANIGIVEHGKLVTSVSSSLLWTSGQLPDHSVLLWLLPETDPATRIGWQQFICEVISASNREGKDAMSGMSSSTFPCGQLEVVLSRWGPLGGSVGRVPSHLRGEGFGTLIDQLLPVIG